MYWIIYFMLLQDLTPELGNVMSVRPRQKTLQVIRSKMGLQIMLSEILLQALQLRDF